MLNIQILEVMAAFRNLSNELLLAIITKLPFTAQGYLEVSLAKRYLPDLMRHERLLLLKMVAREQFEHAYEAFSLDYNLTNIADLYALKHRTGK